MRTSNKRRSHRTAAAAVELAVCAPVLLVFAFGILETTNAIFTQQSLEICAYEGARVALIPGTTAGNVEGACLRMLATRRVEGATVTVSPRNYPRRAYGSEIRVSIQANLADNAVIAPLIVGDRALVGDVIVMKEN